MITIPEPVPAGDVMEGWTPVHQDFLRVFDKMVRLNRAHSLQNKCSVLIHLDDGGLFGQSMWLNMTTKQTKEVIAAHADGGTRKWSNCLKTPFFYFKTGRHGISVWPAMERDDSKNSGNNWGLEE